MRPVDDNPHRMNQYVEHISEYDFSSLHFPVPLSSVGFFTSANNMSINVYGVDDDKKVIYPLRVSFTLVSDRHVYLLLFEHNGIQHYITIRNISSLVGSQISYHEHVVFFCKQCLHAYSTQELLDAHAIDCCHAQRTKFPEDPICRFTNTQKQLPSSFVVSADFESTLKPVDLDVDTTQGEEVGGESQSTFHAVLRSKQCRSKLLTASRYGEDAAEKFFGDLQQEPKQLFDEYIATPKPMLLTATESDRLTTLLPVIYAQNRLEIIVTL